MSEKTKLKLEQNASLKTPPLCANNNPFCPFLSYRTEIARNSQATEKSIWCSEYADDILCALKESEKRRRTLDYKSQQTSYRPTLLMLMKSATDRMSLSRTTLHLAVYLLDCFMDTYTIIMEKLNASALMCLLIAAKIEEADQNIPKLTKFNELVGDVYTMQDFLVVEKKILSSFKYDFIYPTAATFVESYSNQLISYDDYTRHRTDRSRGTQVNVFPSFESMVLETTCLLFNILDISLHDYRLVNYTPSVIGAACLAATRSLRKIEPVWTERLITLTGYHYTTILPYVEALEALYALYAKKETFCDSPDSGIASESKSDSDEDDCDIVDYHPSIKRRRIFD